MRERNVYGRDRSKITSEILFDASLCPFQKAHWGGGRAAERERETKVGFLQVRKRVAAGVTREFTFDRIVSS